MFTPYFNVQVRQCSNQSNLVEIASAISMALFFHNAIRTGSGWNQLQIENILMCLCGFLLALSLSILAVMMIMIYDDYHVAYIISM